MNKAARIQIRLTKESKNLLEKLAEHEERSLSQLAGRIIDSHLELLKKMGQTFHNDYVRLIKSYEADEIQQAFKLLSKRADIDASLSPRSLKRKKASSAP